MYSSYFSTRNYGNKPPVSSTSQNETSRPSTLNLGASGTTNSNVGATIGSLGGNIPNKPSRYTPIGVGNSTSGSNVASSTLNKSSTGVGASSSLFSSGATMGPYTAAKGSYAQRPAPIVTEPSRPRYYGSYGASQSYYQPQVGNVTSNRAPAAVVAPSMSLAKPAQEVERHISSSKSAQNLLSSIPDVFCLSCPPAEYKFSDAYRAKTLPRTGKEVSKH